MSARALAGSIDFGRIRGQTPEGQRAAFEQLVCHLARLERDDGEFRRIEGSGGDGGVEAIRVLPSGRKLGYQAKFHLHPGAIDWEKIEKSVVTALTQHPELERYVIALPCNFTGKRAARGGSTEGAWGQWDTQREKWTTLARSRGVNVEFDPWTAFEIEAALHRPRAQHLIPFFFNRLAFTRAWMQRHRERTLRDLQARYSPDEHVDTESLAAFDVIYRRETVRGDLRAVFDVARACDLDAAEQVADGVVTTAELAAARMSRGAFLALEDAIDWDTNVRWPVNDWFARWHVLTRRLHDLQEAMRVRTRHEDAPDPERRDVRFAQATKVYDLGQPEVFGGRWARLLPIDGARAALFVGRAGAGKSHALARGAEMAWNEGAPVIHLLGQDIVDDDPRISILKRLELTDWSFEEALTAFGLAAEADGRPALLIIDALNEGRGTDVWRRRLASFVFEVNRHPDIVLIMSCREEYLPYVVPPGLIGEPYADSVPLGQLVRAPVEGFRTPAEREAALQKFMDAKGIARPTALIPDDEFFNPLFMSSVCRSMAKAGIKVFPRGLHGIREVYGFVMETKSKALGTRHDGTPQVHGALLSGLQSLAAAMVKQREDHVSRQEAQAVLDRAFQGLPLSEQTWLSVLEGADILRIDVDPRGGDAWSPREIVRFSFQRLQDYLMAECLVRECDDPEGAFDVDGPLAFLLGRDPQPGGETLLRPAPRWVGVLGALWSAVAERHAKELWDLRSFLGDGDVRIYSHEFRRVLKASIRERSGTAFSIRTWDLLNWLWEDPDDRPEKLEILLSTACIPNHAWNADFLSDRLGELSSPERESRWSRWFQDRSSPRDRAAQIVDWVRGVNLRTADPEALRLAATALAWLLHVHNEVLYHDARDALRRVLADTPSIWPDLRERFVRINDPEHLRRLCEAAAAGA